MLLREFDKCQRIAILVDMRFHWLCSHVYAAGLCNRTNMPLGESQRTTDTAQSIYGAISCTDLRSPRLISVFLNQIVGVYAASGRDNREPRSELSHLKVSHMGSAYIRTGTETKKTKTVIGTRQMAFRTLPCWRLVVAPTNPLRHRTSPPPTMTRTFRHI
jgi:hypothetical protein